MLFSRGVACKRGWRMKVEWWMIKDVLGLWWQTDEQTLVIVELLLWLKKKVSLKKIKLKSKSSNFRWQFNTSTELRPIPPGSIITDNTHSVAHYTPRLVILHQCKTREIGGHIEIIKFYLLSMTRSSSISELFSGKEVVHNCSPVKSPYDILAHFAYNSEI